MTACSYLSDDALDCLDNARYIVDDEKSKPYNAYGSAFTLTIAIAYLNRSEAAGKSADYHAIKADILDIAWNRPSLREDICNALSPETCDDPDPVNRLADASAENALGTIHVFIANKAAKAQTILNRKCQAYAHALQRA